MGGSYPWQLKLTPEQGYLAALVTFFRHTLQSEAGVLRGAGGLPNR